MSVIRFLHKLYRYIDTPQCCRFFPSCSAYAVEAFERHGFIKGGGLALWRICRCNPWCEGGFDDVPEKRSKKKSFNDSAKRNHNDNWKLSRTWRHGR